MDSLKAMQTLINNGYKVVRMGLNFKMITPFGLHKIITLTELQETATKLKQVIL